MPSKACQKELGLEEKPAKDDKKDDKKGDKGKEDKK